MSSVVPLAPGFPRFAADAWRELAANGGGIESLTARSDDGIPVGPIYERARDRPAIGGRRRAGPWRIIQRVAAADAGTAIARSGDEAAGGAAGVEFVFAGSAHPLGGRLDVAAAGDVAAALRETGPGGLALRIDAGEATVEAAAHFSSGTCSALDLAFDPLATLATRGYLGRPLDTHVEAIAGAARRFDDDAVDGCAVVADGRLWHAGGASGALELAATVATSVAHLRSLTAGGLPPDRAAARIGVVLAADADQFITIAKFRAARLLLARLFELVEAGPVLPRIHAETAWRMMSRRDPRMNLLRTTSAAVAAVVGGADSLTILPLDAATGADDAVARRLARTSQLVMAAEARLGDVVDPGAGSGAIEALTAALAEAAWTRFQAIEADGGMLAALRIGAIQREVVEQRARRNEAAIGGDITLVGVNAYRDPGETVGGPAVTPSSIPETAAETVDALAFHRLAEPFEADAAVSP
jgi:methylmalonyl-CoA mutase